MTEAFTELKRGVTVAIETYSNVHRGSGYNSMVSTHLYKQAREIVLDYLGRNNGLHHSRISIEKTKKGENYDRQ